MIKIDKPDHYLANLTRQWLDAQFSIPSYCAYEKEKTYGLAVIVSMTSAALLCTHGLHPMSTDHLDIVKPTKKNTKPHWYFKLGFQKEVSFLVAKKGTKALTRITDKLINKNAVNKTRLTFPIIAIDSVGYSNSSEGSIGNNHDELTETNADEIELALITHAGFRSDQVAAVRAHPLNWDHKIVKALNPSLIFLHWSTFEEKGISDDCYVSGDNYFQGSCQRLLRNLNKLLKDTNANIILYTRTSSACQNAKMFFQKATKNGDLLYLDSHKKTRIYVLDLTVKGRRGTGNNRWFKAEATKKVIAKIAKYFFLTDEAVDSKNTIPGFCQI